MGKVRTFETRARCFARPTAPELHASAYFNPTKMCRSSKKHGAQIQKNVKFSLLKGLSNKRNKKSELMLMSRTRAYSSFSSQIILVYLHQFRRSSLLCKQKLPKKSIKTPIFRVQGQSRSLMLTILRSSSPVLVMLSSMSVPICNHFYAKEANSGQITTFYRGTFFNTRVCRLL